MRKISIIIFTSLLTSLQCFAQDLPLPHYLNFDGQLLDSSSNTPINTTTSVTFEIYDPSGACLLYNETQTITPDANGEFSTKIGPSTGNTSSANDGNIPWNAIFKNDGQLRGVVATFCPAGYTPAANDGRRLRITIGANPPLTPDYTLAPVPMATVAETLQGKRASDFILGNPTSLVSNHNGDFQLNNQSSLNLGNATNPSTNYVSIQAPGTFTSYTLTLPTDDGSSGQVLTTDGNGVLSWTAPGGGGAVTSVFGRTGAVVAAANDYSAAQITNTPAGSISATNLQAAMNQLDTGKLSSTAGSVTSTHLLDGTIATADIANNAIDSSKIANGSIVDADITSVDVAKIISTGYLSYAPGGAPCSANQVLKWNTGNTRWECGTDNDLSASKVSLSGDTMTGHLTMNNQSQVRFGDNTTNYVAIRAPTSVAVNYTLTMPSVQGNFGDVLRNDGTGTLSWFNPNGSQVFASSANAPANPDITFLNDSNTGFFNPAPDVISISTNGTEKMRINGLGQLGIGTLSPTTMLDVVKPTTLTNTISIAAKFSHESSNTVTAGFGTGIQFAAKTSSFPNQTLASVDAFWSNAIDVSRTSILSFSTVNNGTMSPKMVITGPGSVGIGTTSPVGDLDVNITGVLRLKKQPSATPPAIGCSTGTDGAVALTNSYVLCVCNGPATTWYRVSDGTTSCPW